MTQNPVNPQPPPTLPGGTVTFLFTDIEGSTRLLQRLHEQYADLLADQRRILRTAFEKWGGQEVDTQGDSFFVSFPRAGDALAAILEAQQDLAAYPWPEGEHVRVRMGLHTGEPWLAEEGYVGIDVHRAARIAHVGHGGQVLLSVTTAELVRNELPEGTSLLDLGKHRLKDIPRPERIHQLVIAGLPSEFPALRSLDARPNNLPTQPTPFVGRTQELSALEALIADPTVRLVTILGAGGMGKTRLALAAAEEQLLATSSTNGKTTPRFPNGVFFVALAPLERADAIFSAVAEAVGFQFYQGVEPRVQLLDYFRQKRTLLVMDNFEHLLGGTELLTEILGAAPGVTALATSREKLNLRGETIYPLWGMRFPDEAALETDLQEKSRYSAVQLFSQSARRARTGFELQSDDLKSAARICRLVGGMPLGIELAAAWVEILSLEEIAAEIQGSLDFLEGEMRDTPERHLSVRALFDHTWKMLSQAEREVFKRLSVFRGGFTRHAAQEVTSTSIKELRSFVSKSLLNTTSTGRYQIHELLRQYAAEELNQSPATYSAARDAHCAFYSAFLHQWESELKTARRITALLEIKTELENVRAAWNWAVAHGQTERLEQALESLATFHHWQGRFQEGEETIRLAAEQISAIDQDSAQQLLVRLLIWQAKFNLELGRTELSTQLSQQSLELLDSPMFSSQDMRMERAAALYCLGSAALRHDYDKARSLWKESFELFRAAGEQWGMAQVLGYLAMIAWELGQYNEAKQLIEENLAIQQALGNHIGIGDMFSTLGWIALTQGQLEQAERLAQKCTTYYRETGDQSRIAKGLRDLAAPKIYLGQFPEADALLEESAALFNELGGSGDLVFTNILLGANKTHLGQYQQARSREELALKLARKFEDRAGMGRALLWLGRVALVEGSYTEARHLLHEASAIFREIGQKDQLSAALASLGHYSQVVGNQAGVRQYLVEALKTALEIGAFLPLLFAIPLASLRAADRGEKKRAVELYTQASHYSFVVNSCWCQDVFGRHISPVTGSLPYDVVAAAQELDGTQDLWATAKELLIDLENEGEVRSMLV